MNLNKALRQRKILQNEIAVTESRLKEAFAYQADIDEDGDVIREHRLYSKEEYDELKQSLYEKKDKLVSLKLKIQQANHKAVEETSIQELILRRGALVDELGLLQNLRTIVSPDRYRHHDEGSRQITVESARELDVQIDQTRINIIEVDALTIKLNGPCF